MSKSTKDIKRMVVNQIKNEYPGFNHLPKPVKKKIIEEFFTQIYSEYDFSKEPEAPLPELLNITPLPDDIITIEQMRWLMKGKQMNILHLKI